LIDWFQDALDSDVQLGPMPMGSTPGAWTQLSKGPK